jgi:hypothetical protein
MILAFENLVVDAGNDRQREEELRKARKASEQKNYYKDYWEHQMRVNADKKSLVAGAGER